MTAPVIEQEQTGPDGSIVVVRLNHGPVSAMDLELCQALAQRFRELAEHTPAGVVLTGTGRAFSAGVDLRRVADEGGAYLERFLPALTDAFQAVFDLPAPLVAAVNGHALAGGCVLAAAADVAVMTDADSWIGLPELKIGVPFPAAAREILRYRLGEARTHRLVFEAQRYLPRQALEYGLVDEIAPADQVLARAVQIAAHFAADIRADAFAFTKSDLRRAARDRMRQESGEVLELWKRRVADGSVAAYLADVTRR